MRHGDYNSLLLLVLHDAVSILTIISVAPSKVPSLMTCHTIISGQDEKKRTNGSACSDLTDFYGKYQPILIEFNLAAEFKVANARTLPSDFIHISHFGVTDATVKIKKEPVQGNILKSIFYIRPRKGLVLFVLMLYVLVKSS